MDVRWARWGTSDSTWPISYLCTFLCKTSLQMNICVGISTRQVDTMFQAVLSTVQGLHLIRPPGHMRFWFRGRYFFSSALRTRLPCVRCPIGFVASKMTHGYLLPSVTHSVNLVMPVGVICPVSIAVKRVFDLDQEDCRGGLCKRLQHLGCGCDRTEAVGAIGLRLACTSVLP